MRALSQNTRSWTTKHQWHTRKPLVAPAWHKTGQPSMQHGKKSHPNIQGLLCQCPQWLCPQFPFAPLVPTSTAGRTATSSLLTITTPSQLIHLCARLWPPQLQQTSICPNQDGGPCTQQTTQTSNLHRTLQKGICPWHVHRTLSVLEILVNSNPSYLNLKRRIFQAQIPDQPVGYPRGLSHCHGCKSHPSTRDLHPSTSTNFHYPSLKGPLRSVYRCILPVQQ
jgi:hypothetical protein